MLFACNRCTETLWLYSKETIDKGYYMPGSGFVSFFYQFLPNDVIHDMSYTACKHQRGTTQNNDCDQFLLRNNPFWYWNPDLRQQAVSYIANTTAFKTKTRSIIWYDFMGLTLVDYEINDNLLIVTFKAELKDYYYKPGEKMYMAVSDFYAYDELLNHLKQVNIGCPEMHFTPITVKVEEPKTFTLCWAGGDSGTVINYSMKFFKQFDAWRIP